MHSTKDEENLLMRFSFKNQRRTEHADSDIESGDLMSTMAHKSTANWYLSILITPTH